MKKLIVAVMLVGMLPLAGQTKPTRKKPTPTAAPTPTDAPTPTPAAPPICRAENRAIRRAAIDLRAVVDQVPDPSSRGMARWEKDLDDAKQKFDAELEMADTGADELRASVRPVQTAFVNLQYTRTMMALGGAKYHDVLDKEDAAKDALNALLACK
jgi:hypothetical protein